MLFLILIVYSKVDFKIYYSIIYLKFYRNIGEHTKIRYIPKIEGRSGGLFSMIKIKP
jgi:hypothetical protein